MADYNLHDWTLRAVAVDWKAGTVILDLTWDGRDYALNAIGATRLSLSREFPWGPSVSVNSCVGPTSLENGLSRIEIEMQSGDRIELIARNIDMLTKPRDRK